MPSDSSCARHILVFEPRLEGHCSDYIRHLVQQFHRQNVPIKLTLLVHPDFKVRFWDAIKSECEHSHECVNLIPLGTQIPTAYRSLPRRHVNNIV